MSDPVITSGDDDTGALNAALAKTGVVVLPPGYHRVTNSIIIPSNTRLIGNGMATIGLETSLNVDTILSQQTVNVHIEGVNIDGRKDLKIPGASRGRGIHLNQVARARVINCHIINTWEHGVRIGGTHLTDSDDTDDVVLSHNTLRGCGHEAVGEIAEHGAGIWCFWRVRDTILTSNMIFDCQVGAIMVDDSSNDATPGKEAFRIVVANNIANGGNPSSSFGRAITFEGTRYFTATGNIITGWNRGIVVTDGQAGSLTGTGTIVANQIRVRHQGVQLADVSDVLVDDNDIEVYEWASVAHAGVKIEQGTTGRSVDRVHVVDNRIRSNGAGISTRMQNGHVPSGAGMNDVKIKDNDLYYTGSGLSNQHTGIYVHGVNRPYMYRNDVAGFYDGIHVADGCQNAALSGGTVERSIRYGVRISSTGCRIRDVDFRDNPASFQFDLATRNASTIVRGIETSDAITGMVAGPTYR